MMEKWKDKYMKIIKSISLDNLECSTSDTFGNMNWSVVIVHVVFNIIFKSAGCNRGSKFIFKVYSFYICDTSSLIFDHLIGSDLFLDVMSKSQGNRETTGISSSLSVDLSIYRYIHSLSDYNERCYRVLFLASVDKKIHPHHICVYLSLYLSIYVFIYLPIFLSIQLYVYKIVSLYVQYVSMYLPINLSIYLYIHLLVYLLICPSTCLSTYLSIYLSIYLYVHLYFVTYMFSWWTQTCFLASLQNPKGMIRVCWSACL